MKLSVVVKNLSFHYLGMAWMICIKKGFLVSFSNQVLFLNQSSFLIYFFLQNFLKIGLLSVKPGNLVINDITWGSDGKEFSHFSKKKNYKILEIFRNIFGFIRNLE